MRGAGGKQIADHGLGPILDKPSGITRGGRLWAWQCETGCSGCSSPLSAQARWPWSAFRGYFNGGDMIGRREGREGAQFDFDNKHGEAHERETVVDRQADTEKSRMVLEA